MTNYQDILYEYEELKLQGRDLTFMEICRYPGSRFEEVCSRILKYFFDPESKCNSPLNNKTRLRIKIRNYGHENDHRRNKEVHQKREVGNYI